MKHDVRLVARRRSPEQIQGLLQAYRHSNQTQRDFARKHGVALATLTNWLRRFPTEPAPPVAWAEVDLSTHSASLLKTPPASEVYQVILPSGTVLRLPIRFDPERVCHLVQLLTRQEV
jgi:transposase-like protein